VVSKRKAAFIHCDYPAYGLNTRRNHRIYARFDRIAAVSESVREIFLSAEPAMAGKTLVVRNCQNHQKIAALAASEPVAYPNTGLNILTVARLSEEKGHLRALEALSALKRKDTLFFGISWAEVRLLLKRKCGCGYRAFGLEGSVRMYGNQSNPYR
jgi:glycosyltransferase involved in cell wall biosynthesis